MQHRDTTLVRAAPLARATTISKAAWVCALAALTFAGAKVVIPVLPVPMTLQTPFVLLAGALLGAKLGALSQLVYLAAGAAGLPVFALGGGLAYLAGPTAGYLLAFPLAAWSCGWLLHDVRALQAMSLWTRTFLALLGGLAVTFALGVSWLAVLHGAGWKPAIASGFVSLQWWALAKYGTTGALVVAALRVHRQRTGPGA